MQDNDPNASASSKPRGLLRSPKLWLSIVGVVLLFVLFLPTIVLAFMSGSIQTKLSNETGLRVRCDSISAGWFSSVQVKNLSVATESGKPVASLKRLRTQKSLFGLLTKDVKVGELQFDSLSAQVPADGETLAEIVNAIQSMNTREGLLSRIVNPDEDTDVQFVFNGVEIQLRDHDADDTQEIASTDHLGLSVKRTDGLSKLTISQPGTSWNVNLLPEVCDQGLKFVAPILEGALAVDGDCSLVVDQMAVTVEQPSDLDLSGTLSLHAVTAEIEAPMIRGLTQAIGQLTENGIPLHVQIANESNVAFQAKDGVVTHNGLSFGLPKVLPSLVLTSGGDVGLDGMLDFQIAASIPFKDMGQEDLLQKLGAPTLSVPVTGTFDEPKVEIGKGKAVAGLARDVVSSLTDGEVDVAPILEKVGELGLLEKLKERRAQKELEKQSEGNGAVDEPTKRDGLFNRLKRLREQRAKDRDAE